jgi:hypothetical protein
MKNKIAIEVSLLVSLLGFFIGGIIQINNEVIDIFLSAITGSFIVFFIAYIIMVIFYRGKDYIIDEATEKKQENNKGKKVDILINDTDEIINNYLNK